jgi:phosphoribosylformylglycinamidine cyclo-ligase
MTKSYDYKSSGVDVETGDALVNWLSQSENKSKTPHADKIVSGIGGFASLFRMNYPEMTKPCLVTCTDGVGTKVKIASQAQRFEGIGQDLVAMCVNDLICTGGEPLMFLDYYATGKLDLNQAKEFLKSVRAACEESNCALIGGETAEMPGVYHNNDFDCAGFAVGIVDEGKTFGAHKVKKGDKVIGIESSGFHSNGYSLLRKVFEVEIENKDQKWLDILLKPTALYVSLVRELKAKFDLHAIAHITGGGTDNVPRVLPEGVTWQMKDWPWPEPFLEVQRRTGMSKEKMLTTLNCGIGLVLVVDAKELTGIRSHLETLKFRNFDLGEIQ